jgi:hypothetical protein
MRPGRRRNSKSFERPVRGTLVRMLGLSPLSIPVSNASPLAPIPDPDCQELVHDHSDTYLRGVWFKHHPVQIGDVEVRRLGCMSERAGQSCSFGLVELAVLLKHDLEVEDAFGTIGLARGLLLVFGQWCQAYVPSVAILVAVKQWRDVMFPTIITHAVHDVIMEA